MGLYTRTQMKPCIRLINISAQESPWRCYKSLTRLYLCLQPLQWGMTAGFASYLILLLEAVALGTLHLCDVLEEVRHADRRMQLARLIRHINRLPLPQGVSVRLHQAASVAAHVLALICGTQKQGQDRAGQDGDEGASIA